MRINKHYIVTQNIFIFLTFFSSVIFSQGFLKTSGVSIVNGNNEEVKLKGIGLGGWLLQEGYMLKTPYSIMGAEHEIKREIEKLVGTAKTEELYEIYHQNYVREIDIDSIASWGFNSIRLPMHYNKLISEITPLTFNEKGFSQIDSLLSWCEKNELYLILDLHAAPGGQSDEPISDYDKTKPSLWESEVNKNLTVKLWKEIASRYSNKEWIGGYDLINEPKWDLSPNNKPLRDLYIEITDSIRTVDTNHIIFIEGNWFATDFNGLAPAWDNNMVYSFHRYWNTNDQTTIQYLVNLRNETNVPLWLGETGENSNSWFLDCIELMKKNNIGWAWWPHKKIDNIAGPLSSPIIPQYQQLLNYWNGSGSKPNETFAYATLFSQFDNLKFEKCKIQYDVLDALIRQTNEKTTIPFKEHKIPGRIYATDYNFGPRLSAYHDLDYENTKGNGGATWNNGWSYRNDGVDIEKCSDVNTNGFNVGWIQNGEWLKYTVDVINEGYYDLNIRIAADKAGGKIAFYFDNNNLTGFIDVPLTGGWQNWQTVNIDSLFLSAGKHEVTLRFYFDGYNINFFEFLPTITGINDETSLPQDFHLFQNYPNPFNPTTTIEFVLPKPTHVTLRIYNMLGQEIDELINSNLPSSLHSIIWDGSKFASGNYYYVLESDEFSNYKKLMLLK